MSSYFSPHTLIHFGRGFIGVVLLCVPFTSWLISPDGRSTSLSAIVYQRWATLLDHVSLTALIQSSVLTVCLLLIVLGGLALMIPTTSRLMRLIPLGLGTLFVGSALFFCAGFTSWGIWFCSALLLAGLALEAAEALTATPAPPTNRLPFEPMHYMI